MATISTHNGTAVAREHNIRNKKVVSKEAHIQPNGHYEIWKDERPREAYQHLFGEAVAKYNAKQTREERKIEDYYTKIVNDKTKHPVYEMIIGVYDKGVDDKTKREILKEFVDTWQERNPNLYMCGAYYHADEEGEPHCHIDYIPVAHNYTKGMETQTGLVKAFEEMGLVKQGKATAQIQWEQRENGYLEKLCRERGIKVEHPKEEGRAHIETETYKAEQKLKILKNEIEELREIKGMDDNIVRNLDKEIEEREHYRNDLNAHIDILQTKAIKTTSTLKEAQEELNTKRTIIETMNDALANLFTRFNNAYKQMQKIFDHWLNNDKRIYVELVAKADRPIKKGNEAMESLLSKSNIIFGEATQEALAQVKEESRKLKEATEELEEIEEEYER